MKNEIKKIKKEDIKALRSKIDKFNNEISNANKEILQFNNRLGDACRISLYTKNKHEFFTISDEILKELYEIHNRFDMYKDIRKEYNKIINQGNEILIDCKNFIESEKTSKNTKPILECFATTMLAISDITNITGKMSDLIADFSEIVGRVNTLSTIIDRIHEAENLTHEEIKYLEAIRDENIRRYIR